MLLLIIFLVRCSLTLAFDRLSKEGVFNKYRESLAKIDRDRLNYPKARQGNTIDVYADVRVKDPYRWLEDPQSKATKKWIEAQNELTFNYLEKIPEREKITNRFTKTWDYKQYSIPFKQGNRYFYYKDDGWQNQYVLYTSTSLEAKPKVLIDPNTFSEDGAVTLSGISVSPDSRLIAYGISQSGSDWQEWKVKDIETGKDLKDTIKWVKFSVPSWTKDIEKSKVKSQRSKFKSKMLNILS